MLISQTQLRKIITETILSITTNLHELNEGNKNPFTSHTKTSHDTQQQVIFEKPNAHFEWEEAERYPDIFPNKTTWIKALQEGKEIDPETTGLVGIINNTDYENNLETMRKSYKTLTKDRRKRIEALFNTNPIKIELPIVMKHNDKYELIAGNTRLTKMGILHRESGFPVRILLIEP